MTDWNRVEKLRSHGASWSEIAADRKIGFEPPEGSDRGRALKTLYLSRKSRVERSAARVGRGLPSSPSSPAAQGSQGLRGRKGVIIALVVVAALIVGTYVYVANESLSGKPTGWVGRAAPDFTLQSANGFGSFTLSSERHHQNVLLFFNEGLTCSPCLGQMQQLDSDVAKFQAQHVLVVSITGDSSSELGSWTSNSDVNATPVLGDPSLTVCNEYDTTGASVSMMPGSAPGHTFILVNETGVVVWRADYGPSDMSVPDATILGAVQAALTP